MDPNILYFEFADHPINNIKYTAILLKIKNNRTLCLLSNKGLSLNEMIGIIKIERNKDRAGVIEATNIFIVSWLIKFLLKSLIASLKGCRIPISPTLLGPFRIWIYPRIFRSKIV